MDRRILGLLVLGLGTIGVVVASVALALNRPSAVAFAPPQKPTPTSAGPASISVDSYTVEAGGYRVTLYPVLADASRVLITYTLAAPPGHNAEAIFLANGISRSWELLGPSLTESGNIALTARPISAYTWARNSSRGAATPTAPSTVTRALAFDRVYLPNGKQVLSLELAGDLVAITSADYDSVLLRPVTETLVRDLKFHFEIPLDRWRRVVELNQIASVGELSLMLEWVASTPSETVFFISGRREPGSAKVWIDGDMRPQGIDLGTSTLEDPPNDYPQRGYQIQHKRNGEQWLLYVPEALPENDEMVLRIKSIVVAPPNSDVAQSYLGPWTFRFKLGPPTDGNAPLAPR